MWKLIRKVHPIWYFDATGGVIRETVDQRQPFLYSLVAHDTKKNKMIPIAEFITTAHNQDNISGFLFHISNYFKTNFSSWLPSVIVTDFSYALINSVCLTFNRCDLGQYISNTYECLKNPRDKALRGSIQTVMYLCSAHFLKMTIKRARKIFKKEKTNKVVQDVFLFTFSLFQNSTTMSEIFELFKHFYNIFMKPNYDLSILNSINYLDKKMVLRNLSKEEITLENSDKNEEEEKIQSKLEKNKVRVSLFFINYSFFSSNDFFSNIVEYNSIH
jgi:hypothetical protein